MVETQPLLPTRIGPYKILRVLGVGGMGTVFHAIHIEHNREVALKVLEPSPNRSDLVLRRFKGEQRAAAMPPHENVVIFYESGEDDGYHYMAMEYIKGRDLLYYIDQKGKLSSKFCLDVIRQAAKALAHAHKHGFVHRDIKPSNFLITRERQVKLTDMGLARQLEELEDARLTRDGTTVGTVDYMAPEQAKNSRDADIRSDIYSLGCTWFHLLTGELPFPGGAPLERLYKHVTDPIPDVRNYNNKVSDPVAHVIKRMMAKDPADRYQTPQELMAVLADLQPYRPSAVETETAHDSDPDIDKVMAAAPRLTKPAKSPSGAKAANKTRPTKKKGRVPRKEKLDPTPIIAGTAGAGVLVAVLSLMFWVANSDRSASPTASPSAQPVAIATVPKPAVAPPTVPAVTKRIEPLPEPPATKELARAEPKPDTKPEPPKTPPPRAAGWNFDLSKVKLDEAPAGGRRKRGIFDISDEDKRAMWSFRAPAGGGASSSASPSGPITQMPAVKLPTDEVSLAVEPRSRVPWSDATRAAVYGPWTAAPEKMARPPRVFPVGRVADDETSASCASSIRQAWNVAQTELGSAAGQVFWVELQSNGPLFDGSQSLFNRPVVLRAADGFVPMLAYQELKSTGDSAWLSFTDNGKVEIEGIHFVLYAGDLSVPNEEFDLIRCRGTDLTIRRCTFTVLGTHRTRMNLVRLLATKSAGAGKSPRVHLQDCVVRGNSITAFSVETAGAEVLVENCCLVSKSNELFLAKTPDEPPAGSVRNLRIVGSSLLAGGEILRDRQPSAGAAPLVVTTADSTWVALPSNQRRPMVVVDLPATEDLSRERLTWKAVRSVYAAWPVLLSVQPTGRPAKVLAEDEASWQSLMHTSEGEEVFADDASLAELDERFPLGPYPHFAAGPWSFSDDTRLVTLGYDSTVCLPLSRFWFEAAFGELERLPIDVTMSLRDNPATNGTVSLELDPRQKSLAQELKKHTTARRIEVRLTGTGRVKITPVTLDKQSLVLKFAPPPTPEAEPLTLEPSGSGDALFNIRGGSLQVEAGRFEWSVGQRAPERFAFISDGELALYSCWIAAPLASKGSEVEELIHFEAGPRPASQQWSRLLLQSTLLASAAPLVSVEAPMTALLAENCLFITQTDAMRISFGEHPPKDWFGSVEINKCTISAAGSAFRLLRFPAGANPPAYPLLFAVEDTIFTDAIDLKGGGENRSRIGSVLTFEADVMTKGILAWQGKNNAFDRRLNRLAVPSGKEDIKWNYDNARLDWLRIWGRRHEANAHTALLAFDGRLRSDRVTIEGLQLSPNEAANVLASDGKQLGPDLSLFGAKVKPTTRRASDKTARPEDRSAAPLARASFASAKTTSKEKTSAKQGKGSKSAKANKRDRG